MEYQAIASSIALVVSLFTLFVQHKEKFYVIFWQENDRLIIKIKNTGNVDVLVTRILDKGIGSYRLPIIVDKGAEAIIDTIYDKTAAFFCPIIKFVKVEYKLFGIFSVTENIRAISINNRKYF